MTIIDLPDVNPVPEASHPESNVENARVSNSEKVAENLEKLATRVRVRAKQKAAKAASKKSGLTPEIFIAQVQNYFLQNIAKNIINLEVCQDPMTKDRISFWLQKVKEVTPELFTKADNVVVIKTIHIESGKPMLCCFTATGLTFDVVNSAKTAFLIDGGIDETMKEDFAKVNIVVYPIDKNNGINLNGIRLTDIIY